VYALPFANTFLTGVYPDTVTIGVTFTRSLVKLAPTSSNVTQYLNYCNTIYSGGVKIA